MTAQNQTTTGVLEALSPQRLNDGSRPSLLELGQGLAGEPEGLSHAGYRAALERISAEVPPFDWTALRSRAWQIEPGDAVVAGPAPTPSVSRPWAQLVATARQWWLGGAVLVAVASAALMSLNPGVLGPGTGSVPDQPYIGMKGPVQLDYFVLQDGEVIAGDDGTALGQGDRIQFTYSANDNDRLVLLSVDGRQAITVFYPEHGAEPETVLQGGPHLLQGSVALDDAPGPEVFLAIFGTQDVAEARQLAAEAHAQGGVAGLVDLARTDPDIAALVIEKSDP